MLLKLCLRFSGLYVGCAPLDYDKNQQKIAIAATRTVPSIALGDYSLRA